MRVVYFGTAPFAVPALERLAPHVVAVVAQPDRPAGRGLREQVTPVRAKALELGLTVLTPAKARAPEFVEAFRAMAPDVAVVAAYGQILSQRLLDVPSQGCFNLHGSVLPRWRGAAPVQRAVEAGDRESGVTLMKMDAGMDTGDMVAVERTPVGPDETAGELYARLATLAGEMAAQWIERLALGEFTLSPQDDSLATHARKVTREDAFLDPGLDGRTAYNRFRGMTPAPGAWALTPRGVLKVTQARWSESSGAPGTVLATRPHVTVAFATGSLELHQVQPEGKPRMSGLDYANGARLAVGDKLLEAGPSAV